MSTIAKGTFDTTMEPHPPYDEADGITLARISIHKRFAGDLEGTATVEMLSAATPVQNSAGYVAIERVSGSLDGRSGSFVLQHSGTMTRGVSELSIRVVPDSGSGDLAGLAGIMTLDHRDGRKLYTLEYTLEPAPVEPARS